MEEIKIGRLDGDAEARACAAMMSSSDPWVFFGRTFEQCLARVTNPAGEVWVARQAGIARGETKPLAGFDQEPYVANSGADERSISDLACELAAVRRANVMMLRALPEEAWRRVGTASDNPVSVRALAFIILGHERHHMGIVRERYLNGA